MMSHFDRVIPRWETDSLKWQNSRGGAILPMWVADMDFASPSCVTDALRRRAEHGVFGYAVPRPEVNQAVIDWLADRYDWRIDPEWLVWLPGLVPALHAACLAFAQTNEHVLTLTPVYPPFLAAPPATGRNITTVPLAYGRDGWTVDIDALRASITRQTRLMLLCHPQIRSAAPTVDMNWNKSLLSVPNTTW